MNKRDFLKKLREYLQYELPESYVESNESYYRDYIEGEIKGGRSEEEVIEDLGDPQLIARSIIDAARSGDDGIPGSDDDRDFTAEIYGRSEDPDGGPSAVGSGYSGSGRSPDPARGFYPGGCFISGGGCLMPILFCLIIYVIFSLLGSMLYLFSPLLAPLCIVFLIIWLLSRRQ